MASNSITQEEALIWWITQLQYEPSNGQELWGAKAGEDFRVIDLHSNHPASYMYFQMRTNKVAHGK